MITVVADSNYHAIVRDIKQSREANRRNYASPYRNLESDINSINVIFKRNFRLNTMAKGSDPVTVCRLVAC